MARTISLLFLCVFSLLVFSGCGSGKDTETGAGTGDRLSGLPEKGSRAAEDESAPDDPECAADIEYWEDGTLKERICARDAEKRGLTIVNLSDSWAPFIFSEGPDEEGKETHNKYRETYVALANDRNSELRNTQEARKLHEARLAAIRASRIREFREQGLSEEEIRKVLGEDETDSGTDEEKKQEEAKVDDEASESRYLELYGIPPSLSVLRRRAEEELKKTCYQDIDYAAIEVFDGFISYKSNEVARSDARKGKWTFNRYEKKRKAAGFASWAEYVEAIGKKLKNDKSFERAVAYKALFEAQKRLMCEGMFPGAGHPRAGSRGGLDWPTHEALAEFERRNRIFGWGFLNDETAKALSEAPEGEIFNSVMRVITERVVDAAAILEDGTIADSKGVMPTYKDSDGNEVVVRNLVSEFSAVALRALGLTSPEKGVNFLTESEPDAFENKKVAIKLPDYPEYYGPQMDIRIVIDRGDVWYDFPFREDGTEKPQSKKRRPKLKVYVQHGDKRIPLVRWGTTIGGWRSEMHDDGFVYYKYKNSDVGERVWHNIVAGPAWLPPEGTPHSDLLKKVNYRHRTYTVPNYNEFGPGYLSAYGLVMTPHERMVETRSGKTVFFDNGIRSHGSFDYMSIQRRHSHGCHRLYNHLAVRLFGFVLRHREFKRLGQIPAGFAMKFTVEEKDYQIRLYTKGYYYELTDPVPVNVLKGNIKGKQKTPIEEYVRNPGIEYGPDASVPHLTDAGIPQTGKKDAAAKVPKPDAGGKKPVKTDDEKPAQKSAAALKDAGAPAAEKKTQ